MFSRKLHGWIVHDVDDSDASESKRSRKHACMKIASVPGQHVESKVTSNTICHAHDGLTRNQSKVVRSLFKQKRTTKITCLSFSVAIPWFSMWRTKRRRKPIQTNASASDLCIWNEKKQNIGRVLRCKEHVHHHEKVGTFARWNVWIDVHGQDFRRLLEIERLPMDVSFEDSLRKIQLDCVRYMHWMT